MSCKKAPKPLPLELISYAGEYLCKSDLANLSLSCKAYHNVLKCALFRRVAVSDVGKADASSLRKLVLGNNGLNATTRHLTLRHREGISKTSDPDALYKAIELFPHLKSLRLEIHDKDEEEYRSGGFLGFTSALNDLRGLVKYVAATGIPPSLDHIQFKVHSEWPDDLGSFDDLPSLPPIKSLRIEWDTDTQEESEYLQFAERISRRSSETLTHFSFKVQATVFARMEQLLPLLSPLRNITHLNLCGPALQLSAPFRPKVDVFIPSLAHLTKLESLRLGCCFADTKPGFLATTIEPIEDLCRSCPQLTNCVMADYLTSWIPVEFVECPFIIHRTPKGIRVTIEYDHSWMGAFPEVCRALGSSLVGWEEEGDETEEEEDVGV